ncbi:unnamed protein product [Phytophthora fragariaefolia]|uniref:Unnamed protein product n=1 Tax=Phytophthora fragariaefolia TaxID=1490495 RepID=A0A9W6TYT5_9STRA|nr:unnamed protein product [Phytophthora fragariaefolia]
MYGRSRSSPRNLGRGGSPQEDGDAVDPRHHHGAGGQDKTSKLDFANGTSEHASICGSVLLQILNEATGKLEDRLMDDVMYLPSGKVNIISLGYLQATGKFKLTCSSDQHIAWLTKPGTTLEFEMTANIYRMRVKKVTEVMMLAAVKPSMGSNRSMELLHQRFGQLGVSTVKPLASKLDVGIEINAKDLSFYDCVACAAGKPKRMSYARISVREFKPLETLVVDICSMSKSTVDGAPMFLFIIDESTRYKRVYLLKKKREAEGHIQVLARLCLLLGYSDNTIGYKFMGLMTAQVETARGGNVTFHEEYTTDGTYMWHLMQNGSVPVARIKTSMNTYLPDRTTASASAAKKHDVVSLEDKSAEHVQKFRGLSRRC